MLLPFLFLIKPAPNCTIYSRTELFRNEGVWSKPQSLVVERTRGIRSVAASRKFLILYGLKSVLLASAACIIIQKNRKIVNSLNLRKNSDLAHR